MLAHDRARPAAGGTFLLRIEDIDGTRPARACSGNLRRRSRMARAGVGWAGAVPVAAAALRRGARSAEGERLLYPCFCTRAEIAASLPRGAPHGECRPLYPGTLPASLGDREMLARRRASRMRGGWIWRRPRRPEMPGTDVAKTKSRSGRLRGRRSPYRHGDVVLARKDAPASYHLAVTVDDAAQGVTHVVRGRDLFAATHVHRLLQAMLELPTPIYRHHPLLADATASASPSATGRRRSPTCATPASRRPRSPPTHCGRARCPLAFGYQERLNSRMTLSRHPLIAAMLATVASLVRGLDHLLLKNSSDEEARQRAERSIGSNRTRRCSTASSSRRSRS
jgi:glutamyl-Q tRNA(Asp) synthetase